VFCDVFGVAVNKDSTQYGLWSGRALIVCWQVFFLRIGFCLTRGTRRPTRTWCQSNTGEHRLHKESEIKERGQSVESTGDDARLSCEVKVAMPREAEARERRTERPVKL
jgi:hypothetical protein